MLSSLDIIKVAIVNVWGSVKQIVFLPQCLIVTDSFLLNHYKI